MASTPLYPTSTNARQVPRNSAISESLTIRVWWNLTRAVATAERADWRSAASWDRRAKGAQWRSSLRDERMPGRQGRAGAGRKGEDLAPPSELLLGLNHCIKGSVHPARHCMEQVVVFGRAVALREAACMV